MINRFLTHRFTVRWDELESGKWVNGGNSRSNPWVALRKGEYGEFINEEVEVDIVPYTFNAWFRNAMVRGSYSPVLLGIYKKTLSQNSKATNKKKWRCKNDHIKPASIVNPLQNWLKLEIQKAAEASERKWLQRPMKRNKQQTVGMNADRSLWDRKKFLNKREG